MGWAAVHGARRSHAMLLTKRHGNRAVTLHRQPQRNQHRYYGLPAFHDALKYTQPAAKRAKPVRMPVAASSREINGDVARIPPLQQVDSFSYPGAVHAQSGPSPESGLPGTGRIAHPATLHAASALRARKCVRNRMSQLCRFEHAGFTTTDRETSRHAARLAPAHRAPCCSTTRSRLS